jgi:GxxExxY protein
METSPLIQIISDVYNEMGPGYKENVYQAALIIELRNKCIQFHSEVICPIEYKGIQVGFERADIVIYSSGIMDCVLELKAQNGNISNKELVQIKKYLRNFDVQNGILVNFSNTLEMYSVTKTGQIKIS